MEQINFRKLVREIRKVIRFIAIYGVSRTITKIFGRLRIMRIPRIKLARKKRNVGIVGCGQFAFSTTAFFLEKNLGNIFLSCYDPKKENATSLARHFRVKYVANSFEEMLSDENLKLLYINSNHYTHAEYAIKALNRNIDVYVEKPIAVNHEQFSELLKAVKKSKAKIFAGFNRPFSAGIRRLTGYLNGKNCPLTLNCFISGHIIPPDHWYRDPKEGTRICENVSHWLDLLIHVLAAKGKLPNKILVQVAYADLTKPDDDVSITITSELHDLAVITLTSRCDPFEGVNETINLQCDDVIAKIDDFRTMTIWHDDKLVKKRFWPKDAGHERAILQPFGNHLRDWHEVKVSTLLMLLINEMVVQKETFRRFCLNDELARINDHEIHLED